MSNNTTPAAPAVYAGISQVIAAMAAAGIAKDRRNEQQGYPFRGIDDVYNALATKLAAAQLCILPRVLSRAVTERATQRGGALFYVVVDVEYDIVSAIDGSRHVARVTGEAMDSADKATNKAMSAAYKYLALQAFCIPTQGDNDADATTHNVHAEPAATPTAAAPSPATVGTLKSVATAPAPATPTGDAEPALRRIALATGANLRTMHAAATPARFPDPSDLDTIRRAIAARARALGIDLQPLAAAA